MTETQALTLAIEALRALKQKYAVDANLHDQLGATHQTAVNASEKRKKIEQAIVILGELRG